MSELVLREDAAAVAVLTLNRPEKLNALSPDLFLRLRDHLRDIHDSAGAVRCVVLKGAGRSFCSGADVEVLKAGTITAEPELRSETVELLGNLACAVIVAVHGHCYTGGLELALAGDIIVAADTAQFCDTHARLGIVPRWGMSARLPLRVGLSVAKLLSFTTAPISAAEALRVGLCDQVVPASGLEDAALALARQIAANNARSLTAIKHLYDASVGRPLHEVLAYERAYSPITRPNPL